jgi:hypothetical protein
LGVPTKRRVTAVLLLATAPAVIYQGSIVSNDACAVFAGSLIAFLAVLAWLRPTRWTPIVLFVAAFAITTLKLADALAVAAVAGVLACTCWSAEADDQKVTRANASAWFRSWRRSGGMLVLGGAVAALTWIVVSRYLNQINPRFLPSFDVLRRSPIGVSQIAHEALSMLNPLAGSYAPFRTNAMGSALGPTSLMNLQPITATIAEYLLLAAGLAGLFIKPRKWAHWLGLFSMASLYVGGILLGIGVWRTYNVDPSLSGRYGLAVAPLLALALVATLRGKWVTRALGGFVAALVPLTILYTFTT